MRRRRGRNWFVLFAATLGLSAASVLPHRAAGAAGDVRIEAALPATANDVNRPVAANSPQLAVHPDDPRFVAMAHRFDGPEFGCGLALSADGGRTWAPAAPVPTLPPGMDRCYAPEVAFDGRGRLQYLFVGLAGQGNVPKGVFLTSSADGGRHFAEPRQVLGPYSFGVRMAIDRNRGEHGRIHLVWMAASGEPPLGGMPTPPNPILAIHSDDGGATWSNPVAVSDPQRTRVVAPAVTLDADGNPHVLYYDLLDDARDYQGLEGPTWDGAWALVATSSGDGGRRFGPGVVVEPDVVPPERVMLIFTMAPAALAAGDDGELYVAWHDARNGDWDVFLRRSTDGGRSWSPPVRVNDEPVAGGRHQYQPRLSVAPAGRVDAVFYDRRADDENVRNDVAYTFSTDGGAHFSPNRMLAPRPSDTRVGQRYVGAAAEGMVEFGSRLGLLSDDRQAVAAWTDTSNAQRQVHQDVFTATVHLSGEAAGGGGVPLWAWVLAGGAGALAVVVAVTSIAGRRRRTAAGRGPKAALAAGVLATVAVGCGGGTEVPLPMRPSMVTVALGDNRFEHRPGVSPGRVVVDATNVDAGVHQLVLVQVPDDLTVPLVDQLRSETRRPARTLQQFSFPPGERRAFAMDLPPGHYGFVCFVTDPDGSSHAQKGMASDLWVGRAPGSPR